MSGGALENVARRESLADRLGATRRESVHGTLIAGPEIGRGWLLSLAQTVIDLGWHEPHVVTAPKYARCGRLETHTTHDFTVPASITTTAATYTCLGHVEVTEAERPTSDTSQFGAWVGAGWEE